MLCVPMRQRQNKQKSERSVTVHVTQLNESKHQSKQTKVDLMSQLQSLSSEILQIKETIQQSSPASQCFAVSNKATMMTTTRQPLQDFSQSYQPVAVE